MKHIKLFKESKAWYESETPEQIAKLILDYGKEHEDVDDVMTDIQTIFCKVNDDLDIESVADDGMSYQEIVDSIKILIDNRDDSWYIRKVDDFLDLYYTMWRRMRHNLTTDIIDELFEDHDYKYKITKSSTSSDEPIFNIWIQDVPHEEAGKYINRYFMTVAGRLPKEWQITKIDIKNNQRRSLEGTEIIRKDNTISIEIVIAKVIGNEIED